MQTHSSMNESTAASLIIRKHAAHIHLHNPPPPLSGKEGKKAETLHLVKQFISSSMEPCPCQCHVMEMGEEKGGLWWDMMSSIGNIKVLFGWKVRWQKRNEFTMRWVMHSLCNIEVM